MKCNDEALMLMFNCLASTCRLYKGDQTKLFFIVIKELTFMIKFTDNVCVYESNFKNLKEIIK